MPQFEERTVSVSNGHADDGSVQRGLFYTVDVEQIVDPIIDEAVQSRLIPGAVLLVGRNNQIIYRKAYGFKAWLPNREPMTLDTIFDAASSVGLRFATSLLHIRNNYEVWNR